jgi:hypothetical protein
MKVTLELDRDEANYVFGALYNARDAWHNKGHDRIAKLLSGVMQRLIDTQRLQAEAEANDDNA